LNYKAILKETLEKIHDIGEINTILKYYFTDRFDAINSSQIVLSENEQKTFHDDISRFAANEPYQYIVEKAYFFNRPYQVNNHVLIPRPETEELVLHCLSLIKKNKGGNINILEVGTGAGCISLSLLLESKVSLNIIAIDISNEALKVAGINAVNYGLKVKLIQLDFLNESEWLNLKDFDIIISNPPYISLEERYEMNDNVLKYEPHLALFSDDPLLFYKKIAQYGSQYAHDPTILCEINPLFVNETKTIFEKAGFSFIQVFEDLQGRPRILQASV
jgi:release factor glutamine methyltransferase